MISSLTNQRVKNWCNLHTKKGRDENGQFLVEEEHLVTEGLNSKLVDCIITINPYETYDVEVVLVDQKVMNKLSKNISEVKKIAVCYQPSLKVNQRNRVLLLDGIQDPGNLGTMIRTAVAFGYDVLYLSEDCSDAYNEKCVRASQGAIFKCPIKRVNLEDEIKSLKAEGFSVIGTSLNNAQQIESVKTTAKMAFVLGNEGQGVRAKLLDQCDFNVIIPITNFESLNVAVAAGIICHQFKGTYDV